MAQTETKGKKELQVILALQVLKAIKDRRGLQVPQVEQVQLVLLEELVLLVPKDRKER